MGMNRNRAMEVVSEALWLIGVYQVGPAADLCKAAAYLVTQQNENLLQAAKQLLEVAVWVEGEFSSLGRATKYLSRTIIPLSAIDILPEELEELEETYEPEYYESSGELGEGEA